MQCGTHVMTRDARYGHITGVPAGDYQIRVTLNPNRAFQEITFDNNTPVGMAPARHFTPRCCSSCESELAARRKDAASG